KTVVVSHTDLDELATTLGGTSVSLQIGGKSDVHTFDLTAEVVSVSATNLKEINVTFSNKVDAATAENANNYTLTAGLVTDASLSEDGKSVTLTLSAAAGQQQSVDLTVENVKDANGVLIGKTSKTVKFFDVVAPVVSSAVVTGPKEVTVNFSEPLQSAPTFSINNGTVAVVSTSWNPGDSKAVLTLGATLTEGTHNVTVEGGLDYAGLKIDKATVNFNYIADVSAPVATVKSATENKVVLAFDEAVLNADSAVNTNVEYYHTYKGTASYKADSVTVSGNEVTLTFNSTPLPEGNVKLFIAYVDENGTKIQDKWGNKLAATTLNASIITDVTAPTVSKTELIDNTKIDVTFSEEVTGGATAANYTLKDAAGNNVAFTVAATVGNTYRITTNAPLNGGSYLLTVKNIKDTSINTNKLADFSTNISVNDTVAPTIAGTAASLSDKKVKVKFSEVMDVASITNKANYKYANLALPADATVVATDNNTAVIITFTTPVVDTNDLKVAAVKDVAGNQVAVFETIVDILPLTTIAATDVAVTGKNSIVLTFDQVITGAVTSDFEYTTDGLVYTTPTAVSTSVVDGKSYITLTTADITDTTAATVEAQTTDGLATSGAKNQYGTALQFSSTLADDKYSASMDSADFTGTLGDDINNESVVITFSEDLYVASVQETDFQVEGYVINGVSVLNNTVTLSLKDAAIGTSVTPKVKLVGEVQDLPRNTTKGPLEVTSN
ncbi:Ig-like domain-containing protein, partial [Oceanihabitans sediminis]|uniref:Ig-like domain-containing protein n=1 Tax=Oceanihabitans sediminis TaxID=1812012 RepID=UPI00299ED83C